MATYDPLRDGDANLAAAAQAAASWARARRATWTHAPLEPVALPAAISVPESEREREPEPERTVEPERHPEPAPKSEPILKPPPAAPPPPAPAVLTATPGQPSSHRVATAMRSAAPRVFRFLAWSVAAVAVTAAAVAGARYALKVAPDLLTRPAPVASTEAGAPAPVAKTTGDLRVNSTPAGARVLVDNEARGVTPLTVADLSPGSHQVVVEGQTGTVRRTVIIVANETADIDVSIFSGWLIVYAPFDVEIFEGARLLQPDDRDQILLAPGSHELRVVNRPLAFETTRRVEIQPGETTTLRLTPPSSTLTVTASETSEVWLDGVSLGETPLNAAPVPLGTHEVVVRRAAGGERRFTVTIGVKPFTLNADFG